MIKGYPEQETSLVVQWLRIYLPVQVRQVPSLIGELRSPCCRATKPGLAATELVCSWACGTHLDKRLHGTTRACELRLRVDASKEINKQSACNAGDLGLIPVLGRAAGDGSSYPLQYSGLENSMDCVVHGVTKSQTWLSNFHSIEHN